MDIKIKVKEDTFCMISSGERTFIQHGFSKNKKYTRLFNNPIENIMLVAEESKQTINKQFKSIQIIPIDDKFIFQIDFE